MGCCFGQGISEENLKSYMTVDTNLGRDSMMNHGKDALSLSHEPKTPKKKKVCFEDFKILKLLGRLSY